MSTSTAKLAAPLLHIKSRFIACPPKLNFDTLASHVGERGFDLLIRKARKKALETFGIPERNKEKDEKPRFYGGGHAIPGREKLLIDGDFCFCSSGPSILYCGVFATSGSQILEIGFVGTDVGDEFQKFITAVDQFLGSKTSEWECVSYESQQFSDLLNSSETKFVPANQVHPQELVLAKTLEEPKARKLALLVKSSGGVLLTDMLKKGGFEPQELNTLLERLAKAELVSREHVVICRKNQNQINRVSNVDNLRKFLELDVRCSCGLAVSQERIEDLYTASEKLQKMLNQSFWMSAWLVGALGDAGIAAERVILNLHEGAEEIDAFVDANGKLTMFELKDREFSLGDAYTFGARVALYKPEYAFIVASKGVAPEVKEHFRKVKLPCELTYIDSLSGLQPEIESLLARLNASQASKLLSSFDRLSNIEIPISDALSQRLGIPGWKNDAQDRLYKVYFDALNLGMLKQ